MASATGIPDNGRSGEEEPLLGDVPGTTQDEGRGLQFNLFIGTATVAQAGIWILAALVWSGVFMHDVIFFSAHPLLNSAGLLFLTQAILLLQPTHTKEQKVLGTHIHFVLNLIGVGALIAGLVVIELNKGGSHNFISVHGIMGLVTYILIFLQALVGFAQFYIPETVFGSVEKGKQIYKFHRLSGYIILLLSLATVCAATQTDFNKNVLHIQLWAVIVAAVLVVLGVGARIKKYKLGI